MPSPWHATFNAAWHAAFNATGHAALSDSASSTNLRYRCSRPISAGTSGRLSSSGSAASGSASSRCSRFQPLGSAWCCSGWFASTYYSLPATGRVPTIGQEIQKKNFRLEGVPGHVNQTRQSFQPKKGKGFLDATSIAILMPTLVLLALIIAAAHKKRLFPWQTIRTFNPPSGLMTPRDYERSYICPPNGRRHGRLGKKNPSSTWSEVDGVVIPFTSRPALTCR